MSKHTSTQQIFDEVICHVSVLTNLSTQGEEDAAELLLPEIYERARANAPA